MTLRIALANIRFASTPDESVQLAKQAVEDAAAAGAAIVCFPECYVPGYRMPDSTMSPPDAAFLERAWATIADAARASNIAVILGTERVVESGTRISALVINRDGSVGGFQDKVQLDPSEEMTYVPGSMRQIFEVDGVKFGISICHEGWRYPETVRTPVRAGAQIVFHPHYHPPEPGAYRPTAFADPANTFHEKAMLCRAAENTCWFASVNYATEGSPTTSAIVTPDGALYACQPYGKEGLLVADVDPDIATRLLAKRLRTS
jgi:predicted amidohydrolase